MAICAEPAWIAPEMAQIAALIWIARIRPNRSASQ
jgi:hypothetical protein